jgi:hypothetical protein
MRGAFVEAKRVLEAVEKERESKSLFFLSREVMADFRVRLDREKDLEEVRRRLEEAEESERSKFYSREYKVS